MDDEDAGDDFRKAAGAYHAQWDASKQRLQARMAELVGSAPLLRHLPHRVRRAAARRAAAAIQATPDWSDIVRAIRRRDEPA